MKRKILHYDGIYLSPSIVSEDAHAGVRMRNEWIHFRRYYPNGVWLGAYRDKSFDFWFHSEQLDLTELETIQRGLSRVDREGNPLWIAGTYKLDDETLIQSLAPDSGGGFEWVTRYSVLDDRIFGPLEGKAQITLLFQAPPVVRSTR